VYSPEAGRMPADWIGTLDENVSLFWKLTGKPLGIFEIMLVSVVASLMVEIDEATSICCQARS